LSGLFRLAVAAALALSLGACGSQARLYQDEVYVFGTLAQIQVWGEGSERAEAAIRAVEADFRRLHREWHAWQPGPLTRLNAALAQGRSLDTEPSIAALIREAKPLYRSSRGLFNPAIGGLIRLWGFHSSEPPDGPPPSDAAIQRWLDADPGMDDLTVTGNKVETSNPSVQLDFGAFAKGVAVDRAIARLRASGIDAAIVNAGGDLRAIGRRGEQPWRIGIRHPQGQGVLASLEVAGDEAVFTSGNYERYREHEGVRYAHIIDPRTGRPVRHVASATVLHDQGSVADAGATALAVAGPARWYTVARDMGLRYAMLVDEAGKVYMSPGMARRVRFQGEARPEIILSDALLPDATEDAGGEP